MVKVAQKAENIIGALSNDFGNNPPPQKKQLING